MFTEVEGRSLSLPRVVQREKVNTEKTIPVEEGNLNQQKMETDEPQTEAVSEGSASGEPVAASSHSEASSSKPTCVIVLGMAGSGKTSFVQVRLELD